MKFHIATTVDFFVIFVVTSDIFAAAIAESNDNNYEEGDSPVKEVISGYDDDCDESKCVSSGLWQDFNSSFSCYTDNDVYPMMCADGYQSQIIEKEDTVYSDNGRIYHYFTCCPTNSSVYTNIIRHCSNATSYSDFNVTSSSCEDDNRPHLRRMKNFTNKGIKLSDYELVESYICCDSIINETINFLNDTECVPYQNEFYIQIVHNSYGSLTPITCNNSENGFLYILMIITSAVKVGQNKEHITLFKTNHSI